MSTRSSIHPSYSLTSRLTPHRRRRTRQPPTNRDTPTQEPQTISPPVVVPAHIVPLSTLVNERAVGWVHSMHQLVPVLAFFGYRALHCNKLAQLARATGIQ